MANLIEIDSVEGIETDLDGYYWDFPEVIFTWGKALKGAKLLKLQGSNFTWYIRAQVKQAALASWQGEVSPFAFEEAKNILLKEGIATLKFQPLGSVETLGYGANFLKGHKSPVWYSHCSWKEVELSANRRWQFRKAEQLFEFIPVSKTDNRQIEEALAILKSWVEVAKTRQWLWGVGHYASCIRLHPMLENSHLFFARRKSIGENIGLVGGYQRGQYSVVVNVKHNYTDKWAIHAIWGFWMDYAHKDLGSVLNCNGGMSDEIKKRMGMERRLHYKPTRARF